MIKSRLYLKITKDIFPYDQNYTMTDSDNHESNSGNSKTKPDESIKIMSVDDEKIKTVGEILSNDSSRAILKILANKEMSANQISQDTDLSIALVAFHLKKMQDVGIIKMTSTGKSVKGQDVKYYSATNQSFLITPAKRADSILDSVKRYSRFAAIGIAGLVSWVILRKDNGEWNSGEEIPITLSDPDTVTKEPRPTLPPSDFMHGEDASSPPVPSPEPTHSGVQGFDLNIDSDVANTGSVSLDKTVYPIPFDPTSAGSVEPFIFSIIIPIAVVVTGIILERLLTRWLIKRKQNKISKGKTK